MAMTNGPNTARPELLDDQLADRSGAEKQLLQRPPKMALAVTHEELRDAFEAHVEGTHVQDGRSDERTDEATLDAGLDASGQKPGPHENSRYGCLVDWAEQLTWHDVPVLQKGTSDEKQGDDQRGIRDHTMKQHQTTRVSPSTGQAMRLVELVHIELIRMQRIRIERIRTQGYHADEVPYNTVRA